MPLNTSIALGYRAPEIQNPLNAMAQFAQIRQADNQNALAQYQIQAAQRAEENENAFNRAYQGAFDPATGQVDYAKIRGNLANSNLGSKIPALEKQIAEQQEAQSKLQESQAKVFDSRLKTSREMLSGVSTPEGWLAWSAGQLKDPILGPMLRQYGINEDSILSTLKEHLSQPDGFRSLMNKSALTVERLTELNAPKYTTQDLGGSTRVIATPGLGGTATVVPGSDVKKTMAPGEAQRIAIDQQRVTQEARRIGLEERRVAVAEQNAARDANPEFQRRMSEARAAGEAAAKGDVAARQEMPKIISGAQDAINLVDQMVGKPEVRDSKGKVIQAGTKPHPGFTNAVGATWLPGSRFVPGTDAAGFQALFDQTKGSAFMSAFSALKGGGSISEKEGEKATAAVTRMSLAQSEEEFVKAAREFQDVMRKGVSNAQKKYGTAPSTSGGVDSSNPLLR